MSRNAFLSRYDLLVLILCIVFMWTSIGSVGGVGRTRAKEYVCRSHLHQWAHIFDSFIQDNEGFFFTGEGYDGGRWWIESLWPYHEASGLFACPAATGSSPDLPATHRAWRIEPYTGSYGLNGWVCSARQDLPTRGFRSAGQYWRTTRTWGAERVPVLADMWWANAWPSYGDIPPLTEQGVDAKDGTEMRLVCINRHDGSVNVLFMDWSVRKVGLKGLWTLKWHRDYDTAGPWTTTGGARPEDWPQWMRKFKDF